MIFVIDEIDLYVIKAIKNLKIGIIPVIIVPKSYVTEQQVQVRPGNWTLRTSSKDLIFQTRTPPAPAVTTSSSTPLRK